MFAIIVMDDYIIDSCFVLNEEKQTVDKVNSIIQNFIEDKDYFFDAEVYDSPPKSLEEDINPYTGPVKYYLSLDLVITIMKPGTL